MKIDFVIPWVDGNDPNWQTERNRYCNTPAEIDESRYRDWDILKYWFRSVETYAPWVNRIHFVTCGQWPQWLRQDHPKLHLVDHKDFIPNEYLPTFNSMSIELNIHRIPDLAEHFVYFNDDVFLNAPVTPECFFRDSLPCDTALMLPLISHTVHDPHVHSICNVMAIINQHFRKKAVLRKAPGKWYTLRYGKLLLKNILSTPGEGFSCFSNPHICVSYLKSTFQNIWDTEPALLDAVCKEKFRSVYGINQYLMRYWQLCDGSFVPRNPRFSCCYDLGPDNAAVYQDIRSKSHKVICVNDNSNVVDFIQTKQALITAFEAVLPLKSSFEK